MLAAHKINAHLSNYKSMLNVAFCSQPVYNYKDAKAASSKGLYSRLFHYLLNKGIYWPPADLESFFVSTQHKAKDLSHLSGQITKFFLKL